MYLCNAMNIMARKIIACFLLLAFLFAVTPKEFIHAMAGHEDTAACKHDGSVAIEASHVHCLVLQLQVNPFHQNHQAVITPGLICTYVILYPSPEVSSYKPAVMIALRGPPVSA